MLIKRLYTQFIHAFYKSYKIWATKPMKNTGPLRINTISSIKTWGYHLPKHAHCCQVFWSSSHCHIFCFTLPIINFHMISVSMLQISKSRQSIKDKNISSSPNLLKSYHLTSKVSHHHYKLFFNLSIR